ncbi:MAG: VCBS repeat-containing protein [Gemmatimonadetes bacterium]|nr:VCBS repeat-containing protein [Gemmatimonadota bacterium]
MRLKRCARALLLTMLVAAPAAALTVTDTEPARYELAVTKTLGEIRVVLDGTPSNLTADKVRVAATMSGLHTGSVALAGDTIVFTPGPKAFLPGDLVSVNLHRSLRASPTDSLAGGHFFAFTIESAPATARWTTVKTYPTASIPYFIHGGDLDNDGTPDLAVPNEGGNNVSIFRNEGGDGVFDTRTDVGVGLLPSSIYGDDFDNDGDQDVATADINGGTMSVLQNDGTGVFTPNGTYPAGIQTRQIHGGDFDGDNDIDLAVTSRSLNRVYLFYNDGTGQFPDVTEYTDVLTGPFAVRTADVNGDGYLDIGVACHDLDSLVVLENQGDGTFVTTGHYRIGRGPWCLNGNDFDGDGDFDFVSVSSWNDRIHMLRNDGTGAFPTRVVRLTKDFPLGVYAGDFDGDGDIDATASCYSGGAVDIFLNDGTGTIELDTTLIVAQSGSYTWAHDLDGDGDLDLSVVDESADSLYVFYNGATPTSLPPGRSGTMTLHVFPNMIRGGDLTTARWNLANGRQPDDVAVYAISGRRVRSVEPDVFGATWDGRDNEGRFVPTGVYFVVITQGGERASRTVRFVR